MSELRIGEIFFQKYDIFISIGLGSFSCSWNFGFEIWGGAWNF